MAISDNIDAKIDAIRTERLAFEASGEPKPATPISTEVQTKATNAILGGTQHWVTYVSLFANDSTELGKLLPTPGITETDIKKNRALAYLGANGMCGMTTGDILKNHVTTDLD
jgi:hypothetical protein